MNKFAIRYMVNPKLHVNKVFRDQLEIKLKETFHSSTQSGVKMQQRRRIIMFLH